MDKWIQVAPFWRLCWLSQYQRTKNPLAGCKEPSASLLSASEPRQVSSVRGARSL
jgi:hypothetical protein